MKTLTEETKEYHNQYVNNQHPDGLLLGVDYYWESRGFSKETVKRFLLGRIVSPVSVEALRHKNRFSIPYLSSDDYCYHLRSRGEGNPKYLPVKNDHPSVKLENRSVHLFNAKDSLTPGVIITEGEIDTITLVQCGYPAVGIPGTSSWRHHWKYLLEDSDPILILDNDDPGKKARETIKSDIPGIKERFLDSYSDVNELYLAQGAEGIKRLINGT